MARVSPLRLRVTLAALALLAAACAPPASPGSAPSVAPVVTAADDAGVPVAARPSIRRFSLAARPGAPRRFEARDGSLVARLEQHVVSATAGETRIDTENGASLALGPSSLTRGDVVLGRAGAPHITTTGELARELAPGIEERWVASAAASEQRWHFAERPVGDGALVVRVPVTSGRLLGTSEEGLLFAHRGGQVRYSHATFVDATGARTDVLARFEGDAIVLRVPSDVVDAAVYPAVLDPLITPATVLAGQKPGTFGAFGDQRSVGFGRFSTSNLLVTYVETADVGGPHLDARRLDATGAPVGSTLRIASGVDVAPATLACNASLCVVFYRAGGHILAKRVDAGGAVLDSTAIDVAVASSVISYQAHDDGSGAVLAWVEPGVGTARTVLARRVASDGTLVGAAATTLGIGTGIAKVSVSSAAPTVVVAWDELEGTAGRLLGMRLDVNMAKLDAVPVVLVDAAAAIESAPTLARRSANLVLAYRSGTSVYGAFVTVTPSLSVGAPTEMYYSSYLKSYELRGDGTTVDFAYVADEGYTDSPRTVYAGRLGANLSYSYGSTYLRLYEQLDSTDFVVGASGPVVVAAGQRGTIFTGRNTIGYDVQSASTTSDARNVTTGAATSRGPVASFAANQFLVTYLEDDEMQGSRISAVRFDPSGTRIDATPIAVATGTFNASSVIGYTRVVNAAIGNLHQVAWQTRSRGYSLTYSQELVSIDSAPVPTLGIRRQLSASSNEPFTLVSGDTSATYFVINPYSGLFRYTLTTSTLGTGTNVLAGMTNVLGYGSRGIAWSASAYLPLRLTTGVSSGLGGALDQPGIAAGSASTLLVHRNPITLAVLARLLSAAGTEVATSNIVVSTGAGPLGPVRVAFDGTWYDVVYTRGSSLYLVRVTENGTVIDGTPALVANDVWATGTPAVASDGQGRVLIAYETHDAAPAVRAGRVSVVLVDWNAPGSGAANGAACTGGFDCASALCVDGVCCDSACGYGVANDCQACSVAAGGAVDGVCGAASTAIVCRASVGPCDVAETCDGVGTVCPGNGFVAAGTLCGALASTPCETDQRCTGASSICPAKAYAPSTTVCRPAASACDAAERCTGNSIYCPNDLAANSSTLCRAADGPCDVADYCNGTSFTCGTDARRPAGYTCRASASACDEPESCDGLSNQCPVDVPRSEGTLCRAAVSSCDVDETCDGVSFACPTDAFAPSTVVCRAAAGPCDVPELCSGASAYCSVTDARKPAGATCRAASGPCDAVETCDGVAPSCPANGFRPAGEVCRPATGTCDVAELCSGGTSSCPADRARVDGSSCDDGLLCNGEEVCMAGACSAGEPLLCAAESPCLEATGQCSVPTRAAGSCSAAPNAGGSPLLGLVVALAALVLARRRASALRVATVALALVATGCVCGVGRANCDGQCTDVAFDEQNCGGCGVSCGVGQCIEGECVSVPHTDMACEDDGQCLDGNYCNGVERCIAGRCRLGAPITCDDGLACTTDSCSPSHGSCIAQPTQPTCGVSP